MVAGLDRLRAHQWFFTDTQPFAAVATLCVRRAARRFAPPKPRRRIPATLARRAEAERARQDLGSFELGLATSSTAFSPVEEEIRRFQATIPVRPTAFSNAARSRSELVTRFVRALEQNDTTALRRLVVDRGRIRIPRVPDIA